VATATATKESLSTDELLLTLATEGEVPLNKVAADPKVIALAWLRGEIEFGRTKYVTTGNPATAVTVHNGAHLPPPAVLIEGGMEWTGPKQRHHGPFAAIKADKLPERARYQKYQLEVCVNKEKDVWEWLENGDAADGRETRYARRDIKRSEAESLFEFRVRLTDKGAESLTA
jgi:hypothetical protein